MQKEHRSVAKRRILIVEDEIITAMSLQHLLELWGYVTCGQATSGREAIEKADAEKPDILLIDVSLSGNINGIQAAKEIRSRLSSPIIFITGYSDKETMKEIQEIEPAGWFVKPVDFDKLKITLDTIAHKSRVKSGKKKGK
jgi:DNA-binding NarL/FixJ family response regulator